MRVLVLASCLLMLLFLLLFGVVEHMQIPLLSEQQFVLEGRGVTAAIVGVGLLIADIVLPVPSSLVMVAHGRLFGVVLGACLSLVGSVGVAVVGFYIGRHGRHLIHRFMNDSEQRQAEAFIDRWGLLAVVATRPVPIVAETVAIMVGTTTARPLAVAGAAFLGALPASVLYALAGAMSQHHEALIFVGVLALTAAFWGVGKFWTKEQDDSPS